jgi:exoribonuclease-2
MPKKIDFMQSRPRRGNVVFFVARNGKTRLGEVLTDGGVSQEELLVQDTGGARNRLKLRDLLLNLGEAPEGLAAVQQQIEKAAAQIDLDLLLAAHQEWNKGPSILVRAIAEEYFGTGAESWQEAAVYLALQRDERFTLSGEKVLYRPPMHKARRRSQHERQQLFDSLRATMTEALQKNWGAAAVEAHPLGKRLARLARAALEQRRRYPESWRKEFIIHLHSLNTLTGYRDARHLLFDWLKKIGRVPPDADLFVFSEPMLRQHARRLQVRNATPSFYFNGSLDNIKPDGQPKVVITIDNPETVDRDDALSFHRTVNRGVEIGVHTPLLEILVPKGTAFDAWAYDVGASAYMPHRTVPMLPAAISSDLGSLNAGNEKPVLSFYFAVDRDQPPRLSRVICERLHIGLNTNYEHVDACLPEITWNELAPGKMDLKEIKEQELLAGAGEALQAWATAAVNLEKQRLANGAKTFNRDEVEVKVGVDGAIKLRHISRDSVAHKMVAEWMIAANQAAAQFCHENNLPCIYRVQEVLGPEREDEDPANRSHGRAQLKPERAPHHDLGVDGYTQITSPLRRYGDLVMQRQIFAFLQTGKPQYSQTDLWARALSIEEMTRRIQRLESRADFYWKCVYLSQHLNEAYTARIGRSQGAHPRIILQLLDLDLRLYVPPSGIEGVAERKIPPYYSPSEVQAICLAMDADKATMKFKITS